MLRIGRNYSLSNGPQRAQSKVPETDPSILRREGIRQFPGICWYPAKCASDREAGWHREESLRPWQKESLSAGDFLLYPSWDYFSKETASLAEIGGSPVGEERREAVPGPGRKRAFARIDRAAGRHRGKRRIRHGEKGKIWILRGAVHPGDFDECGE